MLVTVAKKNERAPGYKSSTVPYRTVELKST